MTSIRDLGEFGLIERISSLLPTSPSVVEGIGDDCAALRIGNRILLVSTDYSLEEVHFSRAYSSFEDIGWKAAASSLSDIAAMGGTPLFGLTTLLCPPDTDVQDIERLYQGLSGAMARFGAVIVGGDTVRSERRIGIDVVVIGEVRGNRFLRRRGAAIGDLLAVTGHLGVSSAGLHALQNGHTAPTLTYIHHHPSSRVPEGQWLAENDAVHAMIDVSDGLIQDAGHLAENSQLGINIRPDSLSAYHPLAKYCEEHGLNPFDFMFTGGEDYELLFAMRPEDHQQTLADFHREFKTAVTIIGEFTDEWTGVRIEGEETSLSGWNHFAQ